MLLDWPPPVLSWYFSGSFFIFYPSWSWSLYLNFFFSLILTRPKAHNTKFLLIFYPTQQKAFMGPLFGCCLYHHFNRHVITINGERQIIEKCVEKKYILIKHEKMMMDNWNDLEMRNSIDDDVNEREKRKISPKKVMRHVRVGCVCRTWCGLNHWTEPHKRPLHYRLPAHNNRANARRVSHSLSPLLAANVPKWLNGFVFLFILFFTIFLMQNIAEKTKEKQLSVMRNQTFFVWSCSWGCMAHGRGGRTGGRAGG